MIQILLLSLCFLILGCDQASPPLHGRSSPEVLIQSGTDPDGDSPLKLVGERLFRESRFSQYFFSQSQGFWNRPPEEGDSVVANLVTLQGLLPNPYRGQAMSCAACHFVEQAAQTAGAGSRAYTDFARHSPIPERGDGLHETARNSPTMVGSTLDSDFLLHHDGEFATPEDLVTAGFLGRNMGWQTEESSTAFHHIAQVVRQDSGQFPTETTLQGWSYAELLAGSSRVPSRLRIPAEYRLQIADATDAQIVQSVVKLVSGYLRTLRFKKVSPFDAFLRKNNLPEGPDSGESAESFADRLLQLLDPVSPTGQRLQMVSSDDGSFQLHRQEFVFAARELRGLRIFLGQARCVSCHAMPDFTDHGFHNTGVAQFEYDAVHGAGSFAKVSIPSLQQRAVQSDFLRHYRQPPRLEDPSFLDLGAWAVFGNPAFPAPQKLLRQKLCRNLPPPCADQDDEAVSRVAIGSFKTPTLRDLGHSAPYFHNGMSPGLNDAIQFYQVLSATQSRYRNLDKRLLGMHFDEGASEDLVAFLKSLNEDYQ